MNGRVGHADNFVLCGKQGVSLKDSESDAELDDAEGGAEASQGPARLPRFSPIVLSKNSTDIHCDVCGDPEGGEK